MPFDRPVLALGPGPRGVQDARRWVGDVCRGIGRVEILECAQLGVSELVTNALLHGAAPIELRLRGTQEHPRIEVRDSSPDAPVLSVVAHPDLDGLQDDLDETLLTFGRGLSIVARASTAWGADLEPDGKVVWFVPASSFAEDIGVEGAVTGEPDPASRRVAPVADPITVHVLGVPIKAYSTFHWHLRELRREVRLLALAHESAYPLAADLSDLFGSLERHLREVIGTEQVEQATAEGRSDMDLEVSMGRAATQSLSRFIELLDLADEFCREERLLSLARSPEQRRFQRWLLGEFVRQGAGGQPIPWTEVHTGRRSVVS
ncbi:MAG: ATP-binding protein [Nocardioides sp.]|nr:ATP-binding protein [Nocardioides sp.]